jgi:hypothetical protein
MKKLADLDKVLTSVAQNLSDFSEIAAAIRQDSYLSEQAVSILRQLNDANASVFIESPALGELDTFDLERADKTSARTLIRGK